MLDVIFATPTLGNGVAIEFLNSAIGTDRLLLANGIRPGWMQRGSDPYLAKVRNKLMSAVLDDFPEADLFFLDDDIGWPPEKVLEFLRRPEDVVAGVYPKKQDDLDFPVALAGDGETGQLIRRDRLVLAREVPTGFLRIKRHVLEALAEQSRVFKEMERGEVRHFREICRMGMDGLNADGWWIGEDCDLSRRIVAAGFEIWVDPSISFSHRGTKTWRASLADHLRAFEDNALATIPARNAEAA